MALETIILASSVLYELIGPVLAKLSLYLSKSYEKNNITEEDNDRNISRLSNDNK